MPGRFGTVMAVAAALVAGSMSTSEQARAADGRNGAIFGGLAAGAILGGALAGAGRGYAAPLPPPGVYGRYPAYEEEVYLAPPRCFVERQPAYNGWGDFVGYRRVRVCD